ncbi:MAG TPA: hypothetical protein VK509_20060, partial [Polyangiales bacterium]|nr:hypothetical protein [Polyangiales bacterium]
VRAQARLTELIATQLELEISGLWLGASYETAARVALAAGDGEAFERNSLLTARAYRHAEGSPLGALYERLIQDARKAGVRVLAQVSEFEAKMTATTVGHRGSAEARVAQTLRMAHGPAARAERALELLCEARAARSGHLCLADDSGLVLAASCAGPAADPALLQLAEEYLREQLDEPPEIATAAFDATRMTATPRKFSDASGRVYHPVLLRCVVDGTPRCAGIALLAIDATVTPQRPDEPGLVAAVGSLLIQAGATAGVATRS